MSIATGETICRICGHRFLLPSALEVGKGLDQFPPDERPLVMLMWQIANHVMKAHKDVNKILETRTAEYLGLLRVLEFQTSEPKLVEQRDLLRWNVLQQMITVRLTDEMISRESKVFGQSLAAQLSDRNPAIAAAIQKTDIEMIAEKVAELVTTYRNMVEEPGKWVLTEAGQAKTGQKAG